MTDKPCKTCRDYRNCNGKPWYMPSDIRYCSMQVLWILENFFDVEGNQPVIEQTTWPGDPDVTGYTDAPKTGQVNPPHRAPFESTLQIIGEVAARLVKTGKDGRLLVLEHHASKVYLSEDAVSALRYCSGWRRKRMSYAAWLRKRRYAYKEKRRKNFYKKVTKM